MPKSQSPDLTEVLQLAIENAQSRVWTALPGRVESFDAATQRASIFPLIHNIYYDENEDRVAERMPVIQDVPVSFLGFGDFRVTCPVKKGNFGTLLFMSCSLAKWVEGDGREVDPGDERRNDLSDAVFVPGLYPFGAPPTSAPSTAMVLHTDGTSASLLLGGDDATDPIIRKSDLQGIYNALTTATTGAGYGADVQSKLSTSYPSGLTASSIVRSK